MKHFLIIFSLFLFFNTAFGQPQTIQLSMDKLLEMTGANNLTIQQYRLQYNLALAEAKVAKEWWIPTLYGGIEMNQLNGAAMNSDGIFFLDVDRQNFWGGVGAYAELDFGKGIFGSQAANQNITAKNYEAQSKRNEIILAVIQSYQELQSASATESALAKMMEQAETIAAQLGAQVDGGFAYKSDLLLAKSNLNHLKIQWKQASATLQKQLGKIKEHLSISQNAILEVTDNQLVKINLITPEQLNNLVVSTSHPAIQTQHFKLKSLEKEVQQYKTGLLLPQLRLGVSNAAFGDLFSPTDRAGNEIGKTHNTFELNGSLMWKLPLNDLFGSGNNRTAKAKIVLQHNQVAQIQNQLNAQIEIAANQLNIAQEAIAIAEEGRAFAKEALNQSIERQKLRTARPYEVFQAQEYVLRAELDFIKSMKEFNQAQYELYVALGNNL